MAYADFNGITGLVRAFLRSSSSWNSSTNSDGEDITGATDETGNADATMANAPSVPEYNDTPTGSGLLGPTILHVAGENGLAIGGLNLSADTSWTLAFTLRADSFGTFRNIFSSQGGAAQGSLYGDSGGTLQYQEASTESTGFTMSTGTVYRVIFTSDASNYRLYIDGTLVWTSTMTPSTGPTALETAAYGGTGAGWAGDWWAIAAYSTTVSGGDIATLDAALLEEAEGVTAGPIQGDATATFTTAGDLAGAGALSGAASATFSASGSLELGAIRGAVSLTVAATATLAGAGALTGIASVSFAASATEASTVGAGGSGLTDYFSGTGGLDGYTTLNAASLPDVEEVGGYYRASVTGSTINDTLHFNTSYGRYDYKLISFPFEVWALGVRVAIPSDPDTEPSVTDEFLFAGLQANNNPASPTDAYQHMVVGHRGAPGGGAGGRTVEIKTTTSGSSSQTDVGEDALTVMRADLRVVGNSGSPNTIDWYWREEGTTTWNGPVTFPGTEPSWNSEIALGLVTYAFEHFGPDFAGYVDALVDMSANLQGSASAALTTAGTLTGYNLVGSASLAMSTAGTVAGAGTLAGDATLSVTAAGGLEGTGAAGAATLAISAAGTLTGAGSLDGDATASFTATGTVAGAGALAGVAAASFAVTGRLEGTGIAAAATIAVTVAGTLAGTGSLAGDATITMVVAGAVAGSGALAGVASASFTVVGTDANVAAGCDMQGSFRKLAETIRGMAASFGVRPYSFTVRSIVWTGGKPGLGTATTTDSTITENGSAPKVTFVQTDELFANDGAVEVVEVGPITPDYNSGAGGTSLATLRPALNGGEEVKYILTGPRYPSGAEFELDQIRHHRGYQYMLVLRRSA